MQVKVSKEKMKMKNEISYFQKHSQSQHSDDFLKRFHLNQPEKCS